VLLEHQVLQEYPDQQDLLVLQERAAPQEQLELLVLLAQPEHQEHQAQQVLLDLAGFLEPLELPDQVELQGQAEPLEPLERLVPLDLRDKAVHQDLQVLQDRPEHPVSRDPQVLQVPLDHQGPAVKPVPQEHQV